MNATAVTNMVAFLKQVNALCQPLEEENYESEAERKKALEEVPHVESSLLEEFTWDASPELKELAQKAAAATEKFAKLGRAERGEIAQMVADALDEFSFDPDNFKRISRTREEEAKHLVKALAELTHDQTLEEVLAPPPVAHIQELASVLGAKLPKKPAQSDKGSAPAAKKQQR